MYELFSFIQVKPVSKLITLFSYSLRVFHSRLPPWEIENTSKINYFPCCLVFGVWIIKCRVSVRIWDETFVDQHWKQCVANVMRLNCSCDSCYHFDSNPFESSYVQQFCIEQGESLNRWHKHNTMFSRKLADPLQSYRWYVSKIFCSFDSNRNSTTSETGVQMAWATCSGHRFFCHSVRTFGISCL